MLCKIVLSLQQALHLLLLTSGQQLQIHKGGSVTPYISLCY